MKDDSALLNTILLKTIQAIEVVTEMEAKIGQFEETLQRYGHVLEGADSLPMRFIQHEAQQKEQITHLRETLERQEILIKKIITEGKETSQAETTGRWQMRTVLAAGGLTLLGSLLAPLWAGLTLVWQWLRKVTP